jgi:hypothetical protein
MATTKNLKPARKKASEGKKRVKRIDVHSHVVPRERLDALTIDPERYKMRYVAEGHRHLAREDGEKLPVFDEFFDAAAKVAGMDRKGLDVSMLSPAPMVYFYWLDADRGLEASRIINDGIANMAAAFPDRLKTPPELHGLCRWIGRRRGRCSRSSSRPNRIAQLDRYGWRGHFRGLFQTPVAA